MNIKNLMNIGRDHLEKYLPKFFRQLQVSGELETHLESAANRTRSEMNSLIEAGYSRDEAWQMTRGRYLILRSDEDEDVASEGNELTRAIFETLSEMTDLRYDLEELEAQTSSPEAQSQPNVQE